MCTINKSAHTKNSGNLFNDPCLYIYILYIYIYIVLIQKNCSSEKRAGNFQVYL